MNFPESQWRCPVDGVFHVADLPQYDFDIQAAPCTKCGGRVNAELIDVGMANTTGTKPVPVAAPVSQTSLTAASVPPSTVTIFEPGGQMMVRIYLDGRLEYGPNYTPDAAAKCFWEALGFHAPQHNIASQGNVSIRHTVTDPSLLNPDEYVAISVNGSPEQLTTVSLLELVLMKKGYTLTPPSQNP